MVIDHDDVIVSQIWREIHLHLTAAVNAAVNTARAAAVATTGVVDSVAALVHLIPNTAMITTRTALFPPLFSATATTVLFKQILLFLLLHSSSTALHDTT